MRRKQITAILLSAIMTVSFCAPAGNITVFATENTSYGDTETLAAEADEEQETDEGAITENTSELSTEAVTDIETAMENEDDGTAEMPEETTKEIEEETQTEAEDDSEEGKSEELIESDNDQGSTTETAIQEDNSLNPEEEKNIEDSGATEELVDEKPGTTHSEGAVYSECGKNLTWKKSGDRSDLTITISGSGEMYDFTASWGKAYTPWESEGIITSVIIEEGVTSVGLGAFKDLKNLKKVELPSSLTKIGNNAFYNCTSLESIIIPNGVTEIGNNAFYKCESMESITLPNRVNTIGQAAFYDCSSLKSVILPDNLDVIDTKLFYSCESLEDVHIPKSIKEIGNQAFYSCTSLKKAEIPNGVTKIDAFAFEGCSSLIRVNIPSGITKIEDYSFKGCTNLTGIIIPSGVNEIGNSAFYECKGLTDIDIPDGVEVIGSNAFYHCSGISRIEIPGSVKNLGGHAFSDCSGLMTVVIPESLEEIGAVPFENTPWQKSLGDYAIINNILIRYQGDSRYAVVPDGISRINNSAFKECRIESIKIPSSVISIGGGAFSDCMNLKSITIPSSVTRIEYQAFGVFDHLNGSLTEIYFDGSCPEMDDYTFSSTLTAYYPINDPSWGDDVKKNYGGKSISWVPWDPEEGGSISFIKQDELVKQNIEYRKSCASGQSMVLYVSYFNPNSGHTIVDDITAETSAPEVLSLESIEKTTEVLSGCILTGVSDECYKIILKGNHCGQSTVTVRAGNLTITSEELSVEPRMVAGTTTSSITITSPVTVACKVNLDSEDADYLNTFINGITYWSHNPYLEIREDTVARTVSDDGKQGEISFVVVPKAVPKQRGGNQTNPSDGPIAVDTPDNDGTGAVNAYDIGFTSGNGQTTGVNLKSGIKPLLNILFLGEDGDPDHVSSQYNRSVCWDPNLLTRGYSPSDIPIRVTVTYNPGTESSAKTATLRKITLSMDKNLEMFKFEGGKSELTAELNEKIPDGKSYTFDAKLVKRGMFWADPGLEPGDSKTGMLNVSIEGDFPGYESLPTDSLTVLIYRENDAVAEDPSGPQESVEQDKEIKQLSEDAYQEYEKFDDKILLPVDLENALTDNKPDAWSRRMNEALKSAIFTEAVTFFYLEDTVKEQSGVSDKVAKQIADKIKKKWWGLEEEIVGLDSSSVKTTFGLLNMRIPGNFDLPMSFKLNHNGEEIICNFVCHISPAPALEESKFGFTGSIDGEVVFSKEDKHVSLTQGMILDYDMTKFAEGAWKVASKELKKGFNMVGGKEMTEALQSFATSRINELVDVAAEYGLERPVGTILNTVYEKKLKSKLDAFEILTYPSKLAVQGNKKSKSASSKEIVARCPVDIYVYDGNGNEVGRFVDDIAENAGENVDMWSLGTEKHIRLYDDTYRLEYIPTGEGIMQLTVYDYKGSSEAVRSTKYEDVPLHVGTNYSQNIEEKLLVDTSTYTLHSDSSEITADGVAYNFGGENSGICGENLTWTLEQDGTLYINGYGDMYDYSGTPVSDYRTQDFRKVVLSDNLTSIGKEAFKGCSSIEEIQFLGNMPAIGDNAFYGVTANAIVPSFWKEFPGEQFGGNITWQKERIDLQAAVVSGITNKIYSGKSITQTITVMNDEVNLVKDEDYTVKYEDNLKTGTAKVIISGMGDYCGTITKTFKITAKKITPTVILSAKTFVYNGKVRKPKVTVKNGSTTLSASNYTVTYAPGLKNPGTYKVTIKLKGNYAGTKAVLFKINPKPTALVKLTPSSKKMTVKWKKQATHVTGYQIQYATDRKFTKNKKTVTVKGAKATAKTITKLIGGKKYYVHIRTYKTVKGKNYYSAWSKLKATVVRK